MSGLLCTTKELDLAIPPKKNTLLSGEYVARLFHPIGCGTPIQTRALANSKCERPPRRGLSEIRSGVLIRRPREQQWPSASCATNRIDHRLQTLGRARQHRRWGQGRKHSRAQTRRI